MSDPTSRTLALLSLLQTHRHWKGVELADRLDVSERTVRRDIDRLRDLGYPVDAEPGVDGGYRLAVGAHIPPLLLDDEEAVALVVGVRAAAVTAIDGIEETSVALMAKLDQMLPDRLRRRVGALQHSVEIMAWSPTTTVPASTLTVLSQGCRDCEEVRFDYRRADGEESRRLVQPHHLLSAGRRWYLVAWDVRRDDWRTFRVDRMEAPALAGAHFEPRVLPAADAATFVTEGMRALSSQHTATVIVDATADDLASLVRWFQADAEALGDDRTSLTLSAESLEWLSAMIAILATRFDIELTGVPDDARALLDLAVDRCRSEPAPPG